MILEPLFGLSLVLNASLNMQNHAAAGASPWTQMSVRQKDAALLPLVRQATDCIVHSMAACMRPVRAMIDAHDRMYGAGSGEAFLLGPYLDVLPAAVVGQVKAKAPNR